MHEKHPKKQPKDECNCRLSGRSLKKGSEGRREKGEIAKWETWYQAGRRRSNFILRTEGGKRLKKAVKKFNL